MEIMRKVYKKGATTQRVDGSLQQSSRSKDNASSQNTSDDSRTNAGFFTSSILRLDEEELQHFPMVFPVCLLH